MKGNLRKPRVEIPTKFAGFILLCYRVSDYCRTLVQRVPGINTPELNQMRADLRSNLAEMREFDEQGKRLGEESQQARRERDSVIRKAKLVLLAVKDTVRAIQGNLDDSGFEVVGDNSATIPENVSEFVSLIHRVDDAVRQRFQTKLSHVLSGEDELIQLAVTITKLEDQTVMLAEQRSVAYAARDNIKNEKLRLIRSIRDYGFGYFRSFPERVSEMGFVVVESDSTTDGVGGNGSTAGGGTDPSGVPLPRLSTSESIYVDVARSGCLRVDDDGTKTVDIDCLAEVFGANSQHVFTAAEYGGVFVEWDPIKPDDFDGYFNLTGDRDDVVWVNISQSGCVYLTKSGEMALDMDCVCATFGQGSKECSWAENADRDGSNGHWETNWEPFRPAWFLGPVVIADLNQLPSNGGSVLPRDGRVMIGRPTPLDSTPYSRVRASIECGDDQGNYARGCVCDKFGEGSPECDLATLAVDAGDSPGDTFSVDDLSDAWQVVSAESPATTPEPGPDADAAAAAAAQAAAAAAAAAQAAAAQATGPDLYPASDLANTGVYQSNAGAVLDNADWSVSDFIPVGSQSVIDIQNAEDNSGVAEVGLFDEDENFVVMRSGADGQFIVGDVAADAAFVRFSARTESDTVFSVQG